ncbi:MAG: tRNA pseudouridine(38-40) synthase TruA [Synergistaceae bacterium]|jgi:tRNA pseudouridine38-40 synthase|nr:tRNA pseudouridine(38-40) synthase TruA [Synergistaceae bacterium]
MTNYAVELSYDGTGFNGWQSQPGGGSVQNEVEAALRELGESSAVYGAGRTDSGVHARAQVANFRLGGEWEPRRLTLALNSKMSGSASVMRSAIVQDGFHARHNAKAREYRYFIWNSSVCYPHIRPYVLWLCGSHYDWRGAESAARLLIGRHDFRSFCRSADCPDTTERTVSYARLVRRGDLVILRIVADSFLTNMVRIAVGNLIEIASGRRDEEWLRKLLLGGQGRIASAQTVAPSGLFLWRVFYNEKISWS